MRTCLLSLAAVTLAACSATDAEQMLVYAYDGGGEHGLGVAPLGSVDDPVRMRTRLGDAVRGGTIRIRANDDIRVRPGPSVYLHHHVDDGVFVPHDEQGLILTSFFHHLDGVVDEMTGLGYEPTLQQLFPMDAVLWNPLLGSELFAIENAAFLGAPDHRSFVLFPDANDTTPLGAHIGVVRHEFGHAFLAEHVPLFHPEREAEVVEELYATPFELRAVHEGFADLIAVLTMDDADVLPATLGRDPREVRRADEVALPTVGTPGDPYSVGVVIASYGWALREQLGDADLTLHVAIDALYDLDRAAWGRQVDASLYWAYTEHLLARALAARPEARDAICALHLERIGQQGAPCS